MYFVEDLDVYGYIKGHCWVFFCSPSYYHNGFVGTHALWAHNVRLHIVGNNEPKSAQKAKQGAQYRWS